MRSALLGELRGLLDIASDDELRVMHAIISRFMGLGRANYGAMNLATDKRDFAKEMSEEAIDALVYWAAESIQRVSAPPSESTNEFASAGGGATVNSTGGCPDCQSAYGESHLSHCPWRVIVPGKGE